MILGIDAREIQDGVVTGIGRSLANFIQYFLKHGKDHELVLFSEKEIPCSFDENVRRIVMPASLLTFFWDQWKLPKALKKNKVDLFYSPYYKVPLRAEIPVVGQVLDLMYLVFPPYRKALGFWGRAYYAVIGKACARMPISIITDSEHAKQDIVQLWKVDPQKITVIPLGLAECYRPVTDPKLLNKVKQKFSLPDKYLLYLGNFKPHKNVESLVRAFKKLSPSFPEYKLVLAGPLDSHGKKIKNIVSNEKIEDKVVFTNTLLEVDKPEVLYTMAEIFVFPTLYEGFGLPPLEAMACGTAVIASNLSAVPEVVGDAGILVNPLDIDQLSSAMFDLLSDHEKRDDYVKKGIERSISFREEQTAGKIFEHIVGLAFKYKT